MAALYANHQESIEYAKYRYKAPNLPSLFKMLFKVATMSTVAIIMASQAIRAVIETRKDDLNAIIRR
jgi:hypothetical protein